MSDKRIPMAGIEAMEAAAFRAGQVARRLRADLQGLHILDFRAAADSRSDASVEIQPYDLETTREIADRFGLTLTYETSPSGSGGFEHARARTEIDGVKVRIEGCRMIHAEEWAAMQADTDTAADTTAGGEQS